MTYEYTGEFLNDERNKCREIVLYGNREARRKALHRFKELCEYQGLIRAVYRLEESMNPQHHESAEVLKTYLPAISPSEEALTPKQ